MRPADFAAVESAPLPAVLPPPSKAEYISLLDMMRRAVISWVLEGRPTMKGHDEN